MSGSAEDPIWADYFDGLRAIVQRVSLTFEDDYRGRVLRIGCPDGEAYRWPLRHIRRLPDQAPGGAMSFGLALGDPARVIVQRSDAALLSAALDDPGGRLAAPPLWPRAAVMAGAGALALAGLVFLALPALAGLLARFMSPEAEVAMGQEHFEMTRALFGSAEAPLQECRSPDGLAALQSLVTRVAGDVDLPYDLQVVVLDDRADPIQNAYAVAGGRITFLDSLIQLADSPEEVAAVLAHELGHVVHSDPVRHTLQAASTQAVLAVLVGDLSGGGVLSGVAGQAMVAKYSRGAELRADSFAHDLLTEANLPPSAMGRFFERARAVWGESEGLVSHFSSHPQLTSRIEAATRFGDPEAGEPALSAQEWAALRAICG